MKKESTKLWLNILLAIAVLNFVAGYYCGKEKEPKLPPPKVMSPAESQQQLKDLGYYTGRIDSKWGPLTDKAYCNYMADRLWTKEQGR